MNFTEAGISLMTVKEVWGCGLAAGAQDGTQQLSRWFTKFTKYTKFTKGVHRRPTLGLCEVEYKS